MFFGNLRILWFLNQISEHGQDDSGDLLLNGIAKNISENGDDVELVHFLRQEGIESEHPQTKNQLILHLEVDSSRQHGKKGGYAIHRNKSKTIFVDAEHHL